MQAGVGTLLSTNSAPDWWRKDFYAAALTQALKTPAQNDFPPYDRQQHFRFTNLIFGDGIKIL